MFICSKPLEDYLKRGLIFGISIGVCICLTSCSVMHVAKGARLEAEGQYEKAIEEWDHAISDNPKSGISYYHRSYDYGKLGRYQDAVDDATKALKLTRKESTKVRAYIARANSYMHLNQYNSAVDDASQAIQINPKSGTAYFYRGQAYQKLGKADLAKSDMAKANDLGYTTEPSKPES